MDQTDIKVMRRRASFEEENARKNALRAIKLMKADLEEAERQISDGGDASHQARNMGQHLAALAESSGMIRTLVALSEWVKPGKAT